MEYNINFINLSGFAIMIECCYNIGGISYYEEILIESSNEINYLESSLGEYYITNRVPEQFRNKWIEFGFKISFERIGKFRTEPGISGNYHWMNTDQFDCVYNKTDNIMTFIKKNPLPLIDIIKNKITSMSDLINMIKAQIINKYFDIQQINMINILIKEKKLSINTDQLIELNDLGILSEIKILYFDYTPDEYFLAEILSNLVNITEIYFSNDFNLQLDFMKNLINLQVIHFGYYFNQPIDILSNFTQLKELVFDDNFTQPISALDNLPNLKIYF
jgi:hypothetical protein